MLSRCALVLGAAALLLAPAQARVNSTGAIGTFMISDCAECTKDKNSAFCSEAKSDSNFVSNSTTRITIRQKKQWLGASAGASYCWTGTFGKITNTEGFFESILDERNITISVDCGTRQIFYRQCVIPAEMAIILMSVAAILCVAGTTCTCFYCGCCKCCNNKGDPSPWGMCNRFCPNAPCADPPEKEDAIPEHLHNPASEEEHASSLFGKNPAFKALQPVSLTDIKKPGGSGGTTPIGGNTPKLGSSAV